VEGLKDCVQNRGEKGDRNDVDFPVEWRECSTDSALELFNLHSRQENWYVGIETLQILQKKKVKTGRSFTRWRIFVEGSFFPPRKLIVKGMGN